MTKAVAKPDLTPPTPVGKATRQPTFVPGVHRRPGRPGYAPLEVIERYMTALRNGNSLHDAALYAGLNPATVEKWLQRGRGVDTDRPATPEYVAFARMVDENRASARVWAVSTVMVKNPERWLGVHGGPEWRDGAGFLPGSITGGAEVPAQRQMQAQQQTQTVDARTMNIVVPADQIPDVVAALLAQKRAQRVEEPVDDVEEEPFSGPSDIRSAGLREDG